MSEVDVFLGMAYLRGMGTLLDANLTGKISDKEYDEKRKFFDALFYKTFCKDDE